MHTNFSEDTKAFLKKSRKAATACELSHCLLAQTQGSGADNVMYIEFQILGKFLIPTMGKGSVTPSFTDKYLRESLYKIDPFIRKASTAVAPFSWNEVLHGQQIDNGAHAFHKVCQEFGMSDGFVVPSQTANGAMVMVSFTGTTDLQASCYDQLHQLATHYRSAMRRLLNPRVPEPNTGLLTPRQLECVRWIAKGKSDWEIATILGLSEATINRHVELAKERLGVHTRVQVVVEALRAGCLDLGFTPGLALPG